VPKEEPAASTGQSLPLAALCLCASAQPALGGARELRRRRKEPAGMKGHPRRGPEGAASMVVTLLVFAPYGTYAPWPRAELKGELAAAKE